MNDYYNHGSYPIYGTQSSPVLDGAEWDKVQAGFAKLPGLTGNAYKITYINAAESAVAVDSATTDGAGTWSLTGLNVAGMPTFATPLIGDNSTKAATTAFAMSMQSPAFTGIPTAPTAAAGTGTTQIATTEFVAAMSFSTNLPGQVGNAGKTIVTDGANASWGFASGTALYMATNLGGM